ncbi:MAG TPA: thioredoxin domain-containing protein [Myxococcota bacterium]|nr:thioredoxin domain-containing protein [Myxococcota bacterium]
MRQIALAAAALWLATAGAACGPSSKDVAELRSKQDEILAKLASIEDTQKKILAQPARAAGPPGEDFDKVYTIALEGSPVRGDAGGAVTIVEFSDFQCPFCARAAPLITELLKKYPKGVKFVYKQFPLPMHPSARAAAEASLAAQEQGKFWEMHDVLIQNQPSLDAAKLDDYAKQAGLDVKRFRSDLDKNKAAYDKRIDAEVKLGNDVDVRGTPTLYIDGKKVRIRTVEGMSAMIDAGLAPKPAS